MTRGDARADFGPSDASDTLGLGEQFETFRCVLPPPGTMQTTASTNITR